LRVYAEDEVLAEYDIQVQLGTNTYFSTGSRETIFTIAEQNTINYGTIYFLFPKQGDVWIPIVKNGLSW